MCRHLHPPKHPPWPPADSPAPSVSVSFCFSTFFPPLSASPSITCPPPSLHLTWGCALAPGGAEKGDAKAGTSLTQGCHGVTGRGDSIHPAARIGSCSLPCDGFFFLLLCPSRAATHRVPPWLFPALATFPFLSPRLCPVMISTLSK